MRSIACSSWPRRHSTSPRRADLRAILGVRSRLVSGHVVRGDDLDDLLVGGAEDLLEMLGSSQVQRPALLPGHGLVGDALEQVLEEAVLPPLRRAWIGLQGQHL